MSVKVEVKTVRLLAHTRCYMNDNDDYELASFGYKPHRLDPDMQELIEAAGRLCYLSWDRPNSDTKDNASYIANIIKMGHLSVLEHATATFLLSPVSRSFTHELVRHRHFSFSQVSQRYVDESEYTMVIPPAVDPLDEKVFDILLECQDYTQSAYIKLVEYFELKGMIRKRAREAARAVLPNATATGIIVTGNLRAFREFFEKRISVGADAEMRNVASEMLAQLLQVAPHVFADQKALING